ncbi:flagellum-specific ATP synthase [[Clostridium] fimetarium]|uniref:Flagellum-specific ATP synthase n=1 Tax=[Clostridium] fimetarium TaxID=99656 RepID=A0A1I0N0T1_9FIRM|nr:flagellar protein export ATPase FliI [[Clostridium] fimetarium]SEV94690.1 flagellum-specific ATP synthase [[Clostridium] fimetarium]
MSVINRDKYIKLAEKSFYKKLGKVSKIVGLTIESIGPDAKLNDLCKITSSDGNQTLYAEVVGFNNSRVLLMPFQSVDGIGPGCMVENTESPLSVKVGDALLGQTLDGLGNPINNADLGLFTEYSVEASPPDPMTRKLISEVLPLGVKAVDSLITVGKGQRIGIFAGSGVGKSTLLGMFARNTKADINVIALIGERGREVREFVERDLGVEGMKRSVLVVATSDKPALIRNKAAKTATAIAEYFRDQGKDVLLMMDSLTRFSMAQREIGLASGEPPVTRGYPPSVYSEMPKLLERAGMSGNGSITGLYTVLVDGDDFNEPITDTARSILDGHIMLSRKLGHKNHYPAIDILQSISRCMSTIVDKEHKTLAGKLKNVLATYNEAEDLINIGAYKNGSNKNIDYAISKIDAVNEFLIQETEERFDFDEEIQLLKKLFEE